MSQIQQQMNLVFLTCCCTFWWIPFFPHVSSCDLRRNSKTYFEYFCQASWLMTAVFKQLWTLFLPDSSLLLRSHAACSLEHSFAIWHVVCWKCTYWCPWGALELWGMWCELSPLRHVKTHSHAINVKTSHIFNQVCRVNLWGSFPSSCHQSVLSGLELFGFCRFVIKPLHLSDVSGNHGKSKTFCISFPSPRVSDLHLLVNLSRRVEAVQLLDEN